MFDLDKIIVALLLLCPIVSQGTDRVDKHRSKPCCFPDQMASDARVESSLYGSHPYKSYGDFPNKRALHDLGFEKRFYDSEKLLMYQVTKDGCRAFSIPAEMADVECVPDDAELSLRYQVRGKDGKGWRYLNGWQFNRAFVGGDFKEVPGLVSVMTVVVDEVTCLPEMYILDQPDGSRDTIYINATTANFEGSDLFDFDKTKCVVDGEATPDANSEL